MKNVDNNVHIVYNNCSTQTEMKSIIQYNAVLYARIGSKHETSTTFLCL